MSWFIEGARRYQLRGKPIVDLCLHNSNVAESLGRKQVNT